MGKSLKHEGVTTRIIVTTAQCIQAIKELEALNPKIVGLDIEWSSVKASNEGKTSLIQIGCKQLILLIRLNLIQSIPGELHSFLGNVSILKAGIGVYGDRKKLFNDYKLSVFGCIDINHIFTNKLSIQTRKSLKAKHHKKKIEDLNKNEFKSSFGLNSMHCALFGEPMKYKNINKAYFHQKWNDKELSAEHIHYAADDALVGYKLFLKMIDFIKNENDNEHATYLSLCYGLIDINLMQQQQKKNKNVRNKSFKGHEKKKRDKQLSPIIHCYVCNKEDKQCNFGKYHIVPTQYIMIMKNRDDEKKQCLPQNNTIFVCKQCKKICDKNCEQFKAELCQKYKISNVKNRKQFIKARTSANALTNKELRYKLPIPLQIDMLQQISDYFNLFVQTVYEDNDNDDDEKNENEYKWQWYNSDRRFKEFEDYPDEISDKIELAYAANENTVCFEVYSYKRINKRYRGKDCKGKHGLKEFKTDSMQFECDGCSVSNYPLGTVLIGCRTCNYDLCQKCFALSDWEIEERIKLRKATNKRKTYRITFASMEQQRVTSEYKRGVRRIYKCDQERLKEFGINAFDHLIKVTNYNEKCGISLTTNDIFKCCIDDIKINGSKSVTSLQKEQFHIHAERLLNIIKDRNEFNNLWRQNFIENVKA